MRGRREGGIRRGEGIIWRESLEGERRKVGRRSLEGRRGEEKGREKRGEFKGM